MNKQELNKCAKKLHEAYLLTGDYSLFSTAEFKTCFSALYEKYAAKCFEDKSSADAISIALFKAIEGYDIERGVDFENYLNRILKHKKIDQTPTKGNKEVKLVSIDKTINDSDGNETELGNLIPDDDESKNIEIISEYRLFIHNLYLMASELALKRPSGKTDEKIGTNDRKAMFYNKLIFTDMLSAYPLKMPDAREFFSSKKTKFGNSVNLDFASSFFVNPCATVMDFFGNTFKLRSEFTHDEKDADKPCMDEANFARDSKEKNSPRNLVVLDIRVYVAYVLATSGKGISAGEISTKRKKFFGALYEESGNPFK